MTPTDYTGSTHLYLLRPSTSRKLLDTLHRTCATPRNFTIETQSSRQVTVKVSAPLGRDQNRRTMVIVIIIN